MSNNQEVQAIFNKVINAGLYNPLSSCDISEKNYMCNSLRVASVKSVISFNEYVLARDAIRGYLKSSMETLYTFLERHNYPAKDADRLAIYKDWANRPQPKVLL